MKLHFLDFFPLDGDVGHLYQWFAFPVARSSANGHTSFQAHKCPTERMRFLSRMGMMSLSWLIEARQQKYDYCKQHIGWTDRLLCGGEYTPPLKKTGCPEISNGRTDHIGRICRSKPISSSTNNIARNLNDEKKQLL
eukprot:scaffold9400_cov58-Cylindrotheca_fusiformis.AAC.2